MAGSTANRGLDGAAVAAALRRMARAQDAPWLHREIGTRLVEHLAPIRMEPERILDWWAGPGGAGAALRGTYPRAEVLAVEPDAAWAARAVARQRGGWWRRRAAAPHIDDREADGALGDASLVVANMTLHGLVDPPAWFARMHALLAEGGVVAFSALGPGSLRELRELYAAQGWPVPTPGFVDMHDFGDMLVAAGFADPVLDQEEIVLTWPNAEAVLAELRALGGNASPARFASLRTPRWRQELLGALARRADANGRIALTFEVAYGHGFKARPRPAPGAPVSLPLETVRSQLRRSR